jgi:hypothetical protein
MNKCYCECKCDRKDEYTEGGGWCESCFERHTVVEGDIIYPMKGEYINV